MRKHLFTIKWRGSRTARTLTPELDNLSSCVWPLGSEDNQPGMAEAFVTMIGGCENLPAEVKHFMESYSFMSLRARYNTDITGVYLLNDPTGKLGWDGVARWIKVHTNDEIAKARIKGGLQTRKKIG